MATRSFGAIPKNRWSVINKVNSEGPYLGLVVPNSFEMSPLLQSPSFVQRPDLPFLDVSGRRFRFGTVGKQKVIMVMTGLSMLNAGLSTELLVNLFDVNGVLHFGIAGNADSDLQVGDVTIPQFWAHTGLWNWQRYGDGPSDELALESNGDYTREIGFLNISDYAADHNKSFGNFLNNVWYQPEEVFPVNGVPEVRQHAIWVAVDNHYYQLSQKLEGMELPQCINKTTCLSRRPKVVRVEKGCSANTFVDNAAYRQFLRSKFDVTPLDMESAAVALVCLQQQVPFIAFRALSDLAGGGSSESNEAAVFGSLAAGNAVSVAVQFISMLSS
ncbi:bark storage protein A [Canna indica]|uniref:Bark storage protein A n=1 Tax=Canna indica TaxID=4628 RepID=A0AAQ3KRQ0_9LILI|nr:bark storage protein A [Canna indica]